MFVNHKLKKIINMLCLLFLFLSTIISILHFYRLVNIYTIIDIVFYNQVLIKSFLTNVSFRAIIMYLWMMNILILVLLWIVNNPSEKTVLLKQLILLYQKQEQPDKLISYMISDTLGNILWSSKFFNQIFKINTKNKHSNIISILEKSEDMKVSNDIIHLLQYNIKMRQSSYVDIPLNIGSWDSCLRISYNRLSYYYVWQVMLIKLDNSIYNHQFAMDLLNNLSLPMVSINNRGLIIYKNNMFVDTFKLNKLKDYFITDIVPYYKDSNLSDMYTCKDSDSNDMDFMVYENHLNDPKRDNMLLYKRLIFSPLDSVESSVEIPKPNDASYGSYLEDIYYNAPFGIIIINKDNSIIKSNKYINNIFGLDGIDSLSLYDIFGDKMDDIQTSLLSTQRQNVDVDMELEIDGNMKLFKIIMFSTGINQQILYMVDISKNKDLENQIKHSQGLQTIGQIASVVAHDFNNLLTAIMSFTYFLQERHDEDDPSRVELEQIKQNANRAKVMIKQLLTFSRKQELKPVVFDVNAEISDLMTTILRLMGEKISPEFKRDKNVGRIFMDKVQFHQVITNLVVNARDAMKKGGKLEILTSPIHLKKPIEGVLGTITPNNYVLIEIKDYGIGIEPKNLKLIFQSYFSTKGDKGTGLGLATVYKIITDNAGFVDIKSIVNKGTSIYLYLPKSDKPAEDDEVKEQSLFEDLTGTETILLVEDELPVRMVCSRLLKSKGYNVIEAHSGDMALDLLKSNKLTKLDLVISDVMMPGLSGPELIARLRDVFVDIKAILISGYTEDILDDINSDISLKGIDFLSKPFTPDVFATKVKSVLNNNNKRI